MELSEIKRQFDSDKFPVFGHPLESKANLVQLIFPTVGMAPSADPQQAATATAPEHFVDPFKSKRLHAHYSKHGPLPSNHTLDHVKSVELTPVIGTEFCDVNVLDWMNASNSDDLIRELARISTLQKTEDFPGCY